MDKFLESNYDEMVKKLYANNDDRYHVLKTLEGRKFKLVKSIQDNIVVVPFTDKSTPMTISKYEIDLFLTNGTGNYDSYTRIILPYLKHEKDFIDIKIEEKYLEKNDETIFSIAVLTHNPKGNWGDIRPSIEKNDYYEKWSKSLNLELGQIVLLYISSDIRQIQYIMEVDNVHEDSLDLRLVDKLSEEQAKLLSFKKLKEHGLRNGTVNYILDNNKELYKYVKSIIGNNITKTTKNKELNIKNIILYGAPGVGKTHNYQNLISMIENGDTQKEMFDSISNNKYVELDNATFDKIKDEKRVEFITFHQNYSYEDFIEGFRPQKNGNIELKIGIFRNICEKAQEEQDKNFFIVIDEINRGNISKIFGELITLIEEDKRDIYEVTLPYSKEKFKIPSNLYIIATMNSTDKSIATIDIALRRRFTFLKMRPNLDLVKNDDAKDMMEKLNIYIEENLGEDYQLGHSYFMKVQNDEDLEFIKEYKIKPLLEEYFYADEKSADEILKEIENKIEKEETDVN